MEKIRLSHPFKPVYDKDSEILILGSFPSVKSREDCFYYGHPQNRFWKVLARIFDSTVPLTLEEKTKFLLHHHIALWDVIAECEITGSSDSQIKNATVNDISVIIKNSNVNRIFVNGNTAYKLYCKYTLPISNIEAIKLSSTSPANASYSLDRLVSEWMIIK